MRPIYTAFYTRGSLYEQEAARLQRSLDRFGLEHDIVAVDSRGSWAANTSLTPDHICDQIEKHKGRNLVQLDADAFVHELPLMLEVMGTHQFDVALHIRRGTELLNGTIWIGATDAAAALMRRYRDRVRAFPAGCPNEQRELQNALPEFPRLRLCPLPPEYCWIHDVMRDDLNGVPPVIEHLQASRERAAGEWLDRRRARVAVAEAALNG